MTPAEAGRIADRVGPIEVTIAICTRDRAASLARTLESLAAIGVPSGLSWELIVVNNGSSDATDAVIERFRSRLPLRRAFEEKPGLANARNCALAAAKGEYIIWTDDDVIVEEHFLAAYLEAFRAHPDAVLFGGKIIPLFEQPTPVWLNECSRDFDIFGLRDFGDAELPLTLVGYRVPYGANFAVRTENLRDRGFNPALGIGPGNTGTNGEEIELIKFIFEGGGQGYWVPRAKVEHYVPRGHQSLTHLRRYLMRQGRYNAFKAGVVDENLPHLFRAPRWMVRRLVESYCRYQFYRWTAAPQDWMPYFIQYALDLGYVSFLRQRRQSVPSS